MDIFVGSLSFKLKESELREAFEKYGNVSSAKIIIDKITRQSKGFGFVEMPNEEEARMAISQLNGAEMYGRPLVVNESQKRESRGDSGAPRGDVKREGFNRPRPSNDDNRGSGNYGGGGSFNNNTGTGSAPNRYASDRSAPARPASAGDRDGDDSPAPTGGGFDRGAVGGAGGNGFAPRTPGHDRSRNDRSHGGGHNDRGGQHSKSKYDDRGKGEYVRKGGGGSKKSYERYLNEDEDDLY
ncbi:RNA recognition motif domain-containing protein [Dyadobacter sandarakinus]|uniref:RNA-binding protein n=1 Tax=Dyadobacter sandarakinus TaxID=2747268 RepID=A0ABX7I7R4_9BACT|nr:RNA-binding protein [Dyadobacter sandarakinus]QRR01964.1 RNA-binding protein [Dyadobacter sandarakinus]